MVKCKHERKRFVTFMDFRGYPEKLFVCEDCGVSIADFITVEDNKNYIKSNAYVPSVTLGIIPRTVEATLSL